VTQLLAANHAPLLAPSPQQLAQYYKARLGLACGSPRLAKREVRALQSLLPGSHAGALLRAQLDLLRQRPRKALKALQPLLGDPLVLHR
jgi:predicted Zn-dependent protease